jgi:carbon starvation protein CstA
MKITRIALLTAGILIAYFVVLDLLGMGSQIYLLFANALIAAAGVYLTIKTVYDLEKEEFRYMDGFLAGIKMGFIAVTLYTVFVGIYIYEINHDLSEELESQIDIAGTGIEAALLLFIFLSGLATIIIASLLFIPLYKRTWNTRQTRASQDSIHGKQQ